MLKSLFTRRRKEKEQKCDLPFSLYGPVFLVYHGYLRKEVTKLAVKFGSNQRKVRFLLYLYSSLFTRIRASIMSTYLQFASYKKFRVKDEKHLIKEVEQQRLQVVTLRMECPRQGFIHCDACLIIQKKNQT